MTLLRINASIAGWLLVLVGIGVIEDRHIGAAAYAGLAVLVCASGWWK